MSSLLFVFIGGGLGASCRFGVSVFFQQQGISTFPIATLLVNTLGSFALGAVFVLMTQKFIESNWAYSLIAIGFLGAFTTFSTFSLDTLLLIQKQELSKAILNVCLNILFTIASIFLAVFLTNKIISN